MNNYSIIILLLILIILNYKYTNQLEKFTNIYNYIFGKLEHDKQNILSVKQSNNNDIDTHNCILNREYNRLNNRNQNFLHSVSENNLKKSRKDIVNLMYIDDPSKIYKANYSQGARGQDYYNIDVNNYRAPIDISNGSTIIAESCVKNLEYQRINNDDETSVLDTYYKSNQGGDINLLELPKNKIENMSNYKDGWRGAKSSTLTSTDNEQHCVLNKEYSRTNNDSELNVVQKYLPLSMIKSGSVTNKVNLMEAPHKVNKHSISYSSMNRLQ